MRRFAGDTRAARPERAGQSGQSDGNPQGVLLRRTPSHDQRLQGQEIPSPTQTTDLTLAGRCGDRGMAKWLPVGHTPPGEHPCYGTLVRDNDE